MSASAFKYPINGPALFSAHTLTTNTCLQCSARVYVCVCVYIPYRCVSAGLYCSTTAITPPSVVVLAKRLTGCLSTGLTCLHGSGPPPALWLPPIDLFQETLAAGRPEIKEEGVGVHRIEGHFTGVPFLSLLVFLFLSVWGFQCRSGKYRNRLVILVDFLNSLNYQILDEKVLM